MEQSDSRHSTIAAFNLDPFEAFVRYIFYQNILYTHKYKKIQSKQLTKLKMSP